MTEQPRSTDPLQQAKTAYEQSEKQASKAMEELVSSQGFAESLAMITGNIAALTRMGNTGMDQLVRMARLAGRNDITRLGRQLARTEDKLEQVLQVVEALETELAVTRAERDAAREAAAGGGAATQQSAPASATSAGTSSTTAAATTSGTRRRTAAAARNSARNSRTTARAGSGRARSAGVGVQDDAKGAAKDQDSA